MRPHLLPLALGLTLACNGSTKESTQQSDTDPADEPPDTDKDTGDDTSDDTGDDTGGSSWLVLNDSCEADPDTEVPITQLGEDQHIQTKPGGWFVEVVDVELDPAGQVLWGVGQGGLMAYDVADPTAPNLLDYYPKTIGIGSRYYRVEVAEELAYTTHRNVGMSVFDITDPSSIEFLAMVVASNMEGMTIVDDRLVVVGLHGTLWVYDLSTPELPTLVSETKAFDSAWDIVVHQDVGYVSDNALGVVPVRLSDPDLPEVLDPIDLGHGVQDLAVGDGALYAAAGSAGVIVLDITDPEVPVVVDELDYGASIQSVAVDDDVLWAVNQEDVIAIDISDPLVPIPLGTTETPEFAMHVTARDGIAYVADWSRLGTWEVDTSIRSPDMDPSVSEIFLREDPETITMTLANTGAADLELIGATLDDERFSVRFEQDTIPPGESAEVEITFEGGKDVDARLCIASNDPVSPSREIVLHTGGGGKNEAIGGEATDFVLTDLDGNSQQLSDQLGHPVVLMYFATW